MSTTSRFERKTHHVVWLLVLAGSLCLVCLPRFNRQDWIVGALARTGGARPEALGDALQYTARVRFFRGQVPASQLDAPWGYRPLVPFLAAFLPAEPMTAINVVNLLALETALFYLYRILVLLGLQPVPRLTGCALFTFSFPSFYYGTIGYVDAALIGFLMAGLYYTLADRWLVALAITLVGALVKESAVILVPTLVTRGWFSGKSIRPRLALVAVSLAAVGAVLVLPRILIPLRGHYLWMPSMPDLLGNISRPHALLSFGLGLGIPGLGALPMLAARKGSGRRENSGLIVPLKVGFATSLCLALYAFFAVHADGRPIWTSYPFSIPLSLFWIQRRRGSEGAESGPADPEDSSEVPGGGWAGRSNQEILR